jgi:sigma-B regulation protein RsbU (phosphoserine phosphatase)
MTTTPEQSGSQTGRQLDALSRLADVTCQLAGLHDIDLILKCVTNGVCEALCCERASLYLFNPDESVLYTRVVTELEIEEIRTSIESGIIGWVARRRQIANVPQPNMDARWNSAVDRSTGFQTRNILAAPVISVSDQQLLGVLQILNRDSGSFGEFDEQLIQAFAAHAATALERAGLLDELRKAQELKVAVDLARRIQIGFLPSSLPGMDGYETADWWEPAESVSGDYYDILQLPDGRVALIVADVTGHGVGPSLIMASVRAMLHVLTRMYSDPVQIVTRLEEAIETDLKDGWFVTLFLATLDLKDHELEYVNAGHGPVIHVSGNQCKMLDATGLPLGVSLDDLKRRGACDMKPGDLLLMATDGSIETRNSEKELFGSGRLTDLLMSNHECPVDEIIDRIRETIRVFHGKRHPADDITMLLVKRVANAIASP